MVEGRREADGDEPIHDHLDTIFTVARATARALGANPFEADEVAQLTAYKLWRHWEHPKTAAIRDIGGPRWRGYIRQVARNTHVDLIRQHQRRMARERRAHEQRTGKVAVETDEGAALWLSVADIEASLARAAIAEEILRLPVKQRQVAVRLWILEMTSREVAAELGLQAQTVRKRARMARESLRERLSESETQAH